jgi:hypothetical protein
VAITIRKLTPYAGEVAIPGQQPAVFSANMQNQLTYEKNLALEVNDTVDDINQSALDIEQNAATAEQAAIDATAAAGNNNYQGVWQSGTSSASSSGETWQFNGGYYVSLQSTSLDPNDDGINWRRVVDQSQIDERIFATPINNSWNGFFDPKHQSRLPSPNGYPDTLGTTYNDGDEWSLDNFASGGSITSSDNGIAFTVGVYKTFTYTSEQLALIDESKVPVYVVDETGNGHFITNSTSGVNITKVDSVTLKVELTSAIFSTLGISKVWWFFVTESKGRVLDLSPASVVYDVYGFYSDDKVFSYKDRAKIVNSSGEIEEYEWYSNVESLSGRDPLNTANRRPGWSDTTKPYYWKPYTTKIAGETMAWDDDNLPEIMMVGAGQQVSALTYHTLAAAKPQWIDGGNPNLLNIPDRQGRFTRAADGTTWIAGETHEDQNKQHSHSWGFGSAPENSTGAGNNASTGPTGTSTVTTTTEGGSEAMPKGYIEWKGYAL